MLTTLCKLFQFCLDCGTLPSIWKVAHITPVFKGGYRKDPLNYRPISLTCCICKLMESCIREMLWQFWFERSLMNPSLFGFTPNSSCTYQLLQYMDEITNSVDHGSWIDAAYLDFSKAFNSVPHDRLLRKLSALGIKRLLLNWIRSFLTHRTEIVAVEGSHSISKQMISEVPQGSCLGSILFIAYVNDINDCHQNTTILKYADDIKIYSSQSGSSNLSPSILQHNLDSLNSWASCWQLRFNVNKCSIMHFGNNNPENHYHLGGLPIPNASIVKDLGIFISSNLKSSQHVSKIVKRAKSILAIIKRTIVSRDEHVFLKLYKQLVRPHLEYASTV